MVVICVALAAWILLGEYLQLGVHMYLIELFFLTEYFPDSGMQAVLQGQWWRLLTPVFLHFGLMHIVFNMLWLWQLGGPLERRLSTGELFVFILGTGIASNLAQYYYSPDIPFGGMSGVVYALLGYYWIQGRRNPNFGMVLHNYIVIMMLIWFAVCWSGLVGDIANMAHTGGLVLGVAWGFVSAELRHPS